MAIQKIPVGILGATGMVGQRLVTLLSSHPWFEIVRVAASENSAGKKYGDVVAKRWFQTQPIPEHVANLKILSATNDIDSIAQSVALVFSAIDAEKEFIRSLEEAYAEKGVPVVSNNSAHRFTEDVPMIIPEINPHHLEMIDIQQKNRSWNNGFIVTKPNCSIQSYIPLLHAWMMFKPSEVVVSTYQAVSGAGKTLETWPEMNDNVVPFISGEEEKSEQEPLKIWATITDNAFDLKSDISISAQCIRVPVSDGHLASIFVRFSEAATKESLIDALKGFNNPIDELNLPSAPHPYITYFEEDNRPQTYLDRDLHQGMGISAGRIRGSSVLGFKCVGLSHNTLRGAAGGSVLNAELLVQKGYIQGR